MKELLQNKKIGIWGFGTVGKSVLSFLSQFDCQISVLDSRQLNPFETALLQGHNVTFVSEDLLPQFLEMNDFIIPSPGINISKFMGTNDNEENSEINEKFITELDLFYAFNKTPTIAITGSVGKTTTVHLLTHILNKLGKKTCAAGNIGHALLDTINQKYDYLVLELSSFQLQYIKKFRPNHGVFLNIYENHLDHHADMPEYLDAKKKLFEFQTEDDFAHVPLEHSDLLWDTITHQKINWVGPDAYEDITKVLSDIIHPNNAQIIISVLETLNLPTENIKNMCSDYSFLPDRMELVATHKGISFYNDSKATIPEATLAAIQKFNKPLLLLGGLSKGVNRIPLLKEVKNNVKKIICFGAEAKELYENCSLLQIPATYHPTLDAAFFDALELATSGDTVLLSPSGSSFDLFKNYHERGKAFKKLVTDYLGEYNETTTRNSVSSSIHASTCGKKSKKSS
jgi:UDP-N-acetylmuramoylalanine--D-glutamate ligase